MALRRATASVRSACHPRHASSTSRRISCGRRHTRPRASASVNQCATDVRSRHVRRQRVRTRDGRRRHAQAARRRVAQAGVGGVIKGWDLAIMEMREGEARRLLQI